MVAWQFAGSLAAVGLLVLLSWKWGFAGPPELRGEEEARALADEMPGGFTPIALSLDRARHGALLRDEAGRVVLVAPAGAHFVARLLRPGIKVDLDEGELVLRGRGISARLDFGPEAADWAKAIERLG
jgi:hypothetical protein